jgi:hypothetical protein
MTMYRLFLAALFIACAAAADTPARAADEFRISNAVYVEGQDRPQSKSVTIFQAGLVYDFLADPAETVVFDKAHGRFALLDGARRVQCEVSTEEVAAFIDQAKKLLAGEKNAPQLHWLAAPTFDETFDSQSSELTLRGEWMTYQAQVLPTGPDVASQYREFFDWYAQFNHVLNPQSRPPYARMMLDAALERNHGIAKEVRLTTNFSKSPVPTKVTSRHELAAQLDASDKTRIGEAREAMKNFKRVSLNEYLKK